MHVVKYTSSYEKDWDSFVKRSKNGTFLFERNFMDYHSDRFDDYSLIIFKKNKIVALLPANKIKNVLYSHLGLSYGGFIISCDMRISLMLGVFSAIKEFLQKLGITELYYKAIPYIYHKYVAEEDLYALFKNNAILYRRDVSTVIDLKACRPSYSKGTKYNIKKASKAGVVFSESIGVDVFYPLLVKVLGRHDVKPVHREDELVLLQKRFPDNIKLYGALDNGVIIAGALVFETEDVAHTQYLASSRKGREVGALDLVISTLIEEVYVAKKYFSFGPSTEDQGKILNEGLIRQKEGFGGRSIVHDFYKLSIA